MLMDSVDVDKLLVGGTGRHATVHLLDRPFVSLCAFRYHVMSCTEWSELTAVCNTHVCVATRHSLTRTATCLSVLQAVHV